MKSLKIFAALLATCTTTTTWAIANPNNIALGKTVTFSAPPNYSLSNDADDIKQLTDGKYSSIGALQQVENTRAIWVQKGTVGWSKVLPVVVTIDLGSVLPISGISYSTAAGTSDVTWPRALYILVSDDNKTWRSVGDLMHLSRKNGLPPMNGYANYRFTTNDLQTKGRYIALGIAQEPYAFVDEIEVYKGDEAWLNKAVEGAPITDVKKWVKEALTPSMVLRRVEQDAYEIRNALKSSTIATARKNNLTAQLDSNVAQAFKINTLPADYKAIIPLHTPHRNILAIHGELLASQGFAPLTVWKQHRYQWLPLLAQPVKQASTRLSISMLKNQHRSDALLLTNASNRPQTVTLQLKNAPRNAQNGWLSVSSIEWIDTAQSIPVADAQLPLTATNGVYRVEVPAGMTRKVWLTVDSSKIPTGSYSSVLEVNGGGKKTAVPFTLGITAMAMQKPRMSLSVWDYTNSPSFAGINPQNRAAAMKLMRSHYVDSTWATSLTLPKPDGAAFDATHQLKGKLDFTNFDAWTAQWPDARRYFVFLAVGDNFAGTKMGTPGFNARVGNWVKAISAHVKSLGKDPKQLGLLLVDEPHSDAQDAIIAAWAKAINATAPELTLFEDPIWLRPDQAKIQEAFTEIDLLCFHIPVYKMGGPEVEAYVQKLRESGKELWMYQATGPVRQYDPQLSYRQLAWHTYSIGGTGMGFWAFGDTAGVPTSWNEYAADYVTFAPVFVDKNTVYNSLHWDAVREGIQDFEELSMLQDAINKSGNIAWKQQAQRVLDDAVQAVTAPWDGNRDWQKKTNPHLTDSQLQKVRKILIGKPK